jgi:hypothetical protein
MVQLLLTNNAKVDSVDVHGKSVLHLAAACGHLVCLQTILAYLTEKDISLLDGQECSALHWACYNGVSTVAFADSPLISFSLQVTPTASSFSWKTTSSTSWRATRSRLPTARRNFARPERQTPF